MSPFPSISAALFGALASTAAAQEVLLLEPSKAPTLVSPAGADSNKVKMLRLPDGTYVAVYGLSQDVGQQVYDVKSRRLRDPYDIVVSSSTDQGRTWSPPINISNTAASASSKGVVEPLGALPLDANGHPDLDLHPRAIKWPGDSDKPNAFNAGNHILVTWSDKLCDSADQRFIAYPELNGVAVPYSCLYASRLEWNPASKAFVRTQGKPYITERLTSGLRDVKADANKGGNPGFVIIWQEDPLGLQLGQGDGPGEGASGARVTHGTDVWYTYIDTAGNTDFLGPMWAPPTRITPNRQSQGELRSGLEITTHPFAVYEDGFVGSSRPNVALVGGTALVAYEETKGTLGWEEGKYIRYHTFPFASPPSEQVGCIISKPDENGRRVRVMTQPGSKGSTQAVFLYKQGETTQGGPSDIMLRRAVGGLGPEYLQPPIDAENCRASRSVDTDPLALLADPSVHTPAINLSGTRTYLDPTGSAHDAGTGDNDYENALAHRGLLRGDLIVVGYSYTPDLYRFTYLGDADPYNFYIRSSRDGGRTWSSPYDISNLSPESGLSVREPRIVPTPSSYESCSSKPNNCQNTDVFYVGFGLEQNLPFQEDAGDVDVYMTLSVDGGATYFTPQALGFGDVLAGEDAEIPDFETQLKLRPDGGEAGIAWGTQPGDDTRVAFRMAVPSYASTRVAFDDGTEATVSVVAPGPPELGARTGDPARIFPDEHPPTEPLHGALSLSVEGIEPGSEARLFLAFEEPLPAGTEVWTYGPSDASLDPHWHALDTTLDSNHVSFSVLDGSPSDGDAAQDGAIEVSILLGTGGGGEPGCGTRAASTGAGAGVLALLVGGLARRRWM